MKTLLMRTLDHTARLTPLLAAALLTACGLGGNADAEPATPPPVTIQPSDLVVAAVHPLSSGPLISGTLEPERQAALRAEVGGVLVAVMAEPGQAVRAGESLARLDDDAIAEQARSAESAVRTAAEALAVARRNAERSETLAREGAVAERDLEQARWNAMNAETALADAEARAAAARKQLDRTVIRAPWAGVISERTARAGDVVQVGNPIVTLVDPGSLQLEATVPVAALEAVKPGTPVAFRVTGSEAAWQGTITRVNPVVDPGTGQVRVRATVPNLAGGLAGGLFAQGTVSTVRKEALAIPDRAVDRRGFAPSVRRLRGGVVELVAVQTGIQDEAAGLIEVLSGIAAGDTLLVGGAATIAAGTAVVVTRE